VLYGRGTESAALDALLVSAQAAQSAVLVVRGEPGVGKTALLAEALNHGADFCVLRGLGVESESELPFAALHRILRPVLAHTARIPRPQADALESSFGLSPSRRVDRFLISVAVLSLLAEVAEQRPVLCVVDDAHWLDHASADALLFVARRLQAEPVAMLFAVREDEPGAFVTHDLPELRVGGLDESAAAQLLRDYAGAVLSPEVLTRLVADARGNPLALRELPGLLSPDQREGREPLPDPLPVGDRVKAAFLQRAHRLPQGTQTLLLVAAADDTGELDVVMRASQTLGASRADLDRAEGAALVRIEKSRIMFGHPLVRSAVYQEASFAARQRAHQALADVLDGDLDADRRAWHRAAAMVGTSDTVADELEAAADRARHRSGYLAACAGLERAAELTSTGPLRARRLTAAAEAAWLAGRPERALALLDQADALAPEGRVRADVQHLRGVIHLRCGIPGDGYAILVAAAREVADLAPEKALAMLFDSGEAAGYVGDVAAIVEASRRAAELPLTSPEATFVVGLLSSVAVLMEGKTREGASAMTAVLTRAVQFEDPRWLVWAAVVAAAIGDERTAHSLYGRAHALARATAAVSTLTNVLEAFSLAGILAGRYATVTADAAEGLALAREARLANSACHHLATLAFVAGVQGREADCRSWAGEAAESASARGLGLQNSIAEWAQALLDLGVGRPTEAMNRLRALSAGGPGTSHPFIVLAATPDLVEAAVRAGRAEVAQTALLALERFAERGAPPTWALALRARCRGLLSAGAAAERHFGEALTLHAQTQRSFDRARTQLAYGEHLRRSRRRLAAREHLGPALDEFERLRAAPWAERAAAELRATGEHARKRDYSTIDQLTPQELQIVRFVGEGATNKDVGAQLFLSPRTIDYHLRRIFIKLGISSRAELIVLRQGDKPTIPVS